MDVFSGQYGGDRRIIAENSHSWKIERISKLIYPYCALRFGNKHAGDAPKVAVNELLRLAKKYSSDKSYKYVKGLLAGVEEQGRRTSRCFGWLGEQKNALP
jgi:transcription termination factor NusB